MIRTRALAKISDYCSDFMSNDEIQNLETGLFNYTIDSCINKGISANLQNSVFLKIYNDKLVSILSNLVDSSYLQNEILNGKIKNNEIKVQDIPSMAPYELFPSRWMSILNAKLKKEKSLLNSDVEPMTDLFKCGKCKERKCSYFELQIRSADESATLFITCLNPLCRNKWRIG